MPVSLAKYVRSAFHGRVLNDVLPVSPTCEHLAEHLSQWLAGERLGSYDGPAPLVRVSATESSWAEYRKAPE
ncbi:hypothetical protein [Streptomyces sp. CEV 2-1]|uniref:hypothetical protein n=1 Tax=Streptomyces sp. CEV 2-1 TaxID=2485153 RepID=UPI00161E3A3E|nr:hypothetical protein [Streptomyces sp. CEV 2-1]